MAEILCCSGDTCSGLLTVGYMASLIKNCKSLKKGGTAYEGSCCTADSSSTVVSFSDMTGTVYANFAMTYDANPNDDISGFAFSPRPTDYNGCCGSISQNNQILKKSEASYRYTEAISNSLSAITEPTICDLYYEVKETKVYNRHIVSCSGDTTANTTSRITTTDKHTDNSNVDGNYTRVINDGSISKNFSQIQGLTNAWDVSFSPSTKTINGVTSDDCNNAYSNTISWNFPTYVVGFNLDSAKGWERYCGTQEKVPCTGTTFEFDYSANTSCNSDFSIDVQVESYDGSGNIVQDDSITISSSMTSTTTIGDDANRSATIEVWHVVIKLDTNTDSNTGGTITISFDGGMGSSSYTCEFIREICGWNAHNVSDPYACSPYWPTVGWEDVSPTPINDIFEVDYHK